MANRYRWDDVKNARPAPSPANFAAIERNVALGQVLYDLRSAAALSQQDLAKRAGTLARTAVPAKGGASSDVFAPLVANDSPADAAVSVSPPACPVCARTMIERTASRGATVGSKFWGCPAFSELSRHKTLVGDVPQSREIYSIRFCCKANMRGRPSLH